MKVIFVVGTANPDEKARGIGARFSLDYNYFYQSLIYELGILPENVHQLFFSSGGMGKYVSAMSVKNDLDGIILEEKKEDVCLVYIGHGQENGWALTGSRDVETLTYEDLHLTFALHSGNLIFLNDCCFGGAGIAALANHSADNLLISPLPANNFGYAYSFLPALIRNWKEQKNYDPEKSGDNIDSKPVVFGNPDLQKLFFLSKIKHAVRG